MRGRTGPLIGSLIFIAIAPGTVAGLIPFAFTRWQPRPPLLAIPFSRVLGAIVLVGGLAILLDCFLRFALEGRGTPSPVAPTETLVVTGLYRYVRNPMYVAVLSIILGQAFVFGSVPLLAYAALVAVLFHAFVIGYEEPTLRRQFGRSYETYSRHVHRWRPRSTAWKKQ